MTALRAADYLREKGWGYHPERMEPRWRAFGRSLRTQQPHPRAGALCVDWGSNEGYFSVKLGGLYANAKVLSVEAEVDEYGGVRAKHLASAEREGVRNNVQCRSQVHGREFERTLGTFGWCWDVQLSLSVMHWFEYTDHDSFLWRLGWLLLSARTTILELPEARVYGPDTGQTRWSPLNRWYGGLVDETALVVKAIQHVQFRGAGYSLLPYKITPLGSMFHQTGTVRTLLRVDVTHPPERTLDWDKLRDSLMC